MKVCPVCRNSYDDSQNFCLGDGAPLVTAETEPETETVVASNDDSKIGDSSDDNVSQSPWATSRSGQSGFTPSPPIVVPTGAAPPPPSQPPPAPSTAAPQRRVEPRRKSNTGLFAALGALGLLSLLVGGWWFFSRSDNEAGQINSNTSELVQEASPSPTGFNDNTSVYTETTARRTGNAAAIVVPNRAVNQSAGAAANNPATVPLQSGNNPPENPDTAPAATPPPVAQPQQPPQPPLSGQETANARREVRGILDSWVAAIQSGDLNGHMAHYADAVQYYRGRYSRSQILADKQRAFQAYDDIQFNVSNVRFTNLTGNTATIVYDKEWRFRGGAKTSEGKVLSQLTLVKIGDRWFITGERDLRVYYNRSS